MKKFISFLMRKSRKMFIPSLSKLTKLLQLKRFSVEISVERVPNFDFSLKAKGANKKCMSAHHYACKAANAEIVRILLLEIFYLSYTFLFIFFFNRFKYIFGENQVCQQHIHFCFYVVSVTNNCLDIAGFFYLRYWQAFEFLQH